MIKNHVTLIGNVGADPEVRYVNPDLPVANFSLATTENYKNKEGERVSNTQWHKCVAWKHLATLVEKYIKKGSFIAVEGSIEYRTYEDTSGQKKYVTEIKISGIEFLGKNENSGVQSQSSNEQQRYENDYSEKNEVVDDEETDDLPY